MQSSEIAGQSYQGNGRWMRLPVILKTRSQVFHGRGLVTFASWSDDIPIFSERCSHPLLWSLLLDAPSPPVQCHRNARLLKY
jgi:hypothetical protein